MVKWEMILMPLKALIMELLKAEAVSYRNGYFDFSGP